MKRILSVLLLVVVILGIAAGAVTAAFNRVTSLAQEENLRKTAAIQERLDETLTLLTALSQDEYICDPEISYEEKAQFLTDINQKENRGYMMLRILDGDINIYKEGIGLASNLGSRDYMQRMYATGEQQVTDAFLAGADGQTINYTVAAAIKENDQVVGGLMAAIYGSEIDELLQEEGYENVLVGSKLQYMGGIPEEQFGLAVAQVLESGQTTSRPVEEILLDFNEKRSGSFWSIGDGIRYFTYSPVEHSDWVVMTETKALSFVRDILAW